MLIFTDIKFSTHINVLVAIHTKIYLTTSVHALDT